VFYSFGALCSYPSTEESIAGFGLGGLLDIIVDSSFFPYCLASFEII
jgi:hypothetical protein